MRWTPALALAAAAANLAGAHPGDSPAEVARERAQRRSYMQSLDRRSLGRCDAMIKARGLEARNVERRMNLAAELREKKGSMKKARDASSTASPLNVSHESSHNYTVDTPSDVLFGTNGSCILQPLVTDGPYYVAGEHLRSDTIEDQAGVDIHLEIQLIDMVTCEPVEGFYAEIWGANATGVYSGVVVDGNGNGTGDPGNGNTTFLRGVQATDGDGVVRFDTLVPGYYAGRTNHIHVLVHPANTTAAPNGTVTSRYAAHVGQLFLDQDVVDEVLATWPYTTNDQAGLTNAEDDVVAEEAEWTDPFLEYVRLGDSVEDGLLGWISFAINSSYSVEQFVAAYLTDEGGKETDDEYTDWWSPDKNDTGPFSGEPGGHMNID